MKKYIQPESTAVCFHSEGAIMAASELGINKEAAQGNTLTNRKSDMWGKDNMWGKNAWE